jgi:hypothetical protein
LADGTQFIGNFENNVLQGSGKIVWPNKSATEGYWRNGDFFGREINLPDGAIFSGTIQTSLILGNKFRPLPIGKGTLVDQNGNAYDGTFDNHRPEGHGVYLYIDDMKKYIGKFYCGRFISAAPTLSAQELTEDQRRERQHQPADGAPCTVNPPPHMQINGLVRLDLIDGSNFYGYLLNNKFEGWGRFESSNGTVYEGLWSNGMRNGQGTQTAYIDGQVISSYTGNWKNDDWKEEGTYQQGDISVKHHWSKKLNVEPVSENPAKITQISTGLTMLVPLQGTSPRDKITVTASGNGSGIAQKEYDVDKLRINGRAIKWMTGVIGMAKQIIEALLEANLENSIAKPDPNEIPEEYREIIEFIESEIEMGSEIEAYFEQTINELFQTEKMKELLAQQHT